MRGLDLDEFLDALEPVDILLEGTVSIMTSEVHGVKTTHLLLLVLGILRNEQSEAIVDTTLRQELLELLLDGNVKCVELDNGNELHDGHRDGHGIPGDQCRDPDASSPPQPSAQYRSLHQGRRRCCR